MSSDAQVFANSVAIQHQAQRGGLRWLEGKMCNVYAFSFIGLVD